MFITTTTSTKMHNPQIPSQLCFVLGFKFEDNYMYQFSLMHHIQTPPKPKIKKCKTTRSTNTTVLI